jgi:adenylosuccinate lyase
MQYRRLPLTARTHNVPAQPTTWGKRLAMFGEETLRAARRLDSLRADYPARGLKGAVGTQLDPWTLFDGRTDRVSAWEQRVMRHLGFRETLKNTGQVYPRSLDFEVVAALYQLACGPSNFARTLRLMAGHELASEGFAKGQVGSSAMPHKMNSRSCERVNGFQTILRGHVTMAAALAGDQWNEGDVSCSVVRRALLPDVFFVIDGLLDTTLTVLNQMETHEGVINRENERGMPFLATTTILMEAVKAGAGREQAHEAIREHATAVIRDLRDGRIADNDLADRLAADARLKLNRAAIDRVIVRAGRLTGRAGEQVAIFAREAKAFLRRIPGAADYRPGAIL